jgi:hypothetical protein
MIDSRAGSHSRRSSSRREEDSGLDSPRSTSSRPDYSTLLFDSEDRPALAVAPRTTAEHQYSNSTGSSSSSSVNVNMRARLDYGEREDSVKPELDHPTEGDRGKKPGRGIAATFIIVVAIVLAITGIFSLLTTTSDNRPRRLLAPNRLSTYLPAAFFSITGSSLDDPPPGHPIIPLLISAATKWTSLLASQSTTFDKATKTYKAKYGSTPPPGFDKWFAFATQGRNHTLVDEYDSLMADLAPYRALTSTELKRRTAELAQLQGISIVSIRNGKSQVHSKSGRWAPALAFQQMMEAFVRDLPDMDIAINEKPEGRVLPRQERSIAMDQFGMDEDDLTRLSESKLIGLMSDLET